MARLGKTKLKATELGAFAFAVAALFMLFNTAESRAPIASSETRFVEYSKGGMQIVPASCPSNPHFAGECTVIIDSYSQSSYSEYAQGTYSGTCPIGYTRTDGGECQFTGCPEGFVLENGTCVAPPQNNQCAPYYCVGPNLYQNNAQCVGFLVQNCAFGCSGSGCLPAPPGNGNITVTPALVRSGERTTVAWETSGMVEESCYVVENNPTINDSGAGETNSFVTSPIRQQTSYTLICTTQDDEEFRDSATVNIIPIFEES